MRVTEEREVTTTTEVAVADECDYCGKRDDSYVKAGWWFPPPGWVMLKWGSDPLYSPERLACPECAATRDLALDRAVERPNT